MCGIAGLYDPHRALEGVRLAAVATAMADALRHRGPDDHGVWTDPGEVIALAHRRLSIIDLSPAGHQPMLSHDGRWAIVYNGELYNTEELRSALPPRQWRGHSDTEVLLEAVAHWGVERTMGKINAMIACALWDLRDHELWLARDRFGEKPLYYGRVADRWAFASELKAFEALEGFDAEIDPEALALLLRFGSIPAPWSIYRGVRKLPAGHLLRIRADDPSEPQRYFDPRSTSAGVSPGALAETAADELEAVLAAAVSARMVSDVPLGAFLSGGIDSSLVVALMQQASVAPVRTFTIGFGESDYDEAPFARRVARHLGTDHTELTVTAQDALAVIPELPSVYCEPFGDSSQIPTCLVSRLARQQVTVALSGDGGDELFGGYDRYRVIGGVDRWAARTPAILQRMGVAGLGVLASPRWEAMASGRLQRVLPAIARRRPAQKADKLARLLAAPAERRYLMLMSDNLDADSMVLGAVGDPAAGLYRMTPNRSVVEQAMLADTEVYLPDDLLTKVDRASMSTSLEVRVPFLDPNVYALARRLGASASDGWRSHRPLAKAPLKDILRRHVPSELVDRPKMGFGVPIADWLRGPLRRWGDELLDPVALRAQGLIDATAVQTLWTEHLERRRDHAAQLWPILMFQAWFEARLSGPRAGS